MNFDYRALSWYEDTPQIPIAAAPAGQRAARSPGANSRIAALASAARRLQSEE